MSSTFPTSIDSFANPTSTKINGTDYVKAQHVNDLQDAVRAIEICLTGSGLNMKIGSNNYIPESASVKFSIEIIDATMKMIHDALTTHHDSMAITDPVQHHANVIEVASGTSAIFADIQPRRAQTVLEVIRTEITRILNGETVRG